MRCLASGHIHMMRQRTAPELSGKEDKAVHKSHIHANGRQIIAKKPSHAAAKIINDQL